MPLGMYVCTCTRAPILLVVRKEVIARYLSTHRHPSWPMFICSIFIPTSRPCCCLTLYSLVFYLVIYYLLGYLLKLISSSLFSWMFSLHHALTSISPATTLFPTPTPTLSPAVCPCPPARPTRCAWKQFLPTPTPPRHLL